MASKSGKQLTVEDLWSIPLAHGCSWLPPMSPIPEADRSRYIPSKPIRLVEDTYAERAINIQYDWDTKFEKAYKIFVTYPASPPWWRKGWDRTFSRSIDAFRWKLHMRLLDWGVII